MFIRIGGVPGVGKTTVINEIVKKSSRLSAPVVKVKGAEYLMDILGISTYEQLRGISEQERAQARPEMYKRMYEEDRNDPSTIRLRDAHFTLWQNGSSFVEFPVLEEDKRQMLSMVCLTAPVATIYERRKVDGRSDRALEGDIIQKELTRELEVAGRQADLVGINLVQVENIGDIPTVCAKIVRKTMGGFEFQQELLSELLEGTSHKERF
jgi:adenylate kinase